MKTVKVKFRTKVLRFLGAATIMIAGGATLVVVGTLGDRWQHERAGDPMPQSYHASK